MISVNVVLLDVYFLAFWDSETVYWVIEDCSWLMGFDWVHTANLIPLFVLQRVSDASAGPFAFLNDTSNEIDVLAMVS